MPEGFLHLFSRRPVGQIAVDVLDLLVVAVLIYRVLLVLKGTRAAQMGLGVGLVFLVYIGAKWIGLVTLQNIFSSVLSSFILILVVVFQNDIRRALTRIGSNALFGGLGRALETQVVDEVVAATTELARHRIGALIAFEQDANLDEFVVGQGIRLDSAVTRELLVTIFVPEPVNKLHDGAVIIRNLRIAKAGVFFPMPEARTLDPSFGSRHRAALGITEETDAVVVAVSEERATISFCFNGNIVTNLDGEELRTTLLRIFGRAQPAKKGKKDVRVSQIPPSGPPSAARVAVATPPPPRVVRTPAPSSPPPSGPKGPETPRQPSGPVSHPMPATETPKTKEITSPMPVASTPGSDDGGSAG
jgi:uncharacterized protein (TIGR00159 family)